MRSKIKYRRILIFLLVLNIIGIFAFGYNLLNRSIPDVLKVRVGKSESYDFNVPLEAHVSVADQSVVEINNKAVPKDEISIDLNSPFTMKVSEQGSMDVAIKWMGLTLKKVKVDTIEDISLMPSGDVIGIYIKTNGIMILGTGKVTGKDGIQSEPAKNIVKSGDYIQSMDGQPVNSTEDITNILNESQGNDVILKVLRDGESIDLKIKPVATSDGEYKIGIWIRDDTQGIGTLSFVDENNNFGALGHGIADIDTSLLIDIEDGELYTSKIMSIVKGENGTPGEMVGTILYNSQNKIGQITKNTDSGIYGEISAPSMAYDPEKALPIGLKQDIHEGDATIRCKIGEEVKEYDVVIESIEMNSAHPNKDIVLKVVDEALLSETNGIIQGMSGSPIIQDGKFIGVVTHVFLNDCKRGYGIFIENMLNAMNQ